jgi:transposase
MRLVKLEGISQREAAQRAGKEHGFSESRCENIRRRIGRALTPQESKPRPRLLDEKMEEMMYSVVQAFSTLANPLGTVELQALAQVLQPAGYRRSSFVTEIRSL